MTPRDLFVKIRMSPEINDNAAVKYSDYQLISALNSVLSIVYNTLSSSSNSILNKTSQISLTESSGDLPEDFLSTISVFAPDGTPLNPQSKSFDVDEQTYKITGNNIYSKNESIKLVYKPYFVEVIYSTIDTALALPNYFSELLKKYSVISLIGGINKQDSTIVQQVTSDVYSLTSGREYTAIVVKPAWRV